MQINRPLFFCYSDISAVFYAAIKKDDVPFPFEFAENEIPVTNYCKTVHNHFIFFVLPKMPFHLCLNLKPMQDALGAHTDSNHEDTVPII